MSVAESVAIHYLRPPDRSETFVQQLVHESADAIVTFNERTPLREPMLVDDQPVLEDGSPVVWFTFPGLWHDAGRFHLRDGTFTGLYANILTPVRFETPREWHTTDLFLDVWVPALQADAAFVRMRSGRHAEAALASKPYAAARLLDEDELLHAMESGWLDAALAARARAEATWLVNRTADGSWPTGVVSVWPLERVLQHLTDGGTS